MVWGDTVHNRRAIRDDAAFAEETRSSPSCATQQVRAGDAKILNISDINFAPSPRMHVLRWHVYLRRFLHVHPRYLH